MLEHAPTFSSADAERIATELYARRGPVRPLTSERDQNFLIGDDRDAIILKIANATEERALLEAQQHVLAIIAQRDVPTPRVVCTSDGQSIARVADAVAREHFV